MAPAIRSSHPRRPASSQRLVVGLLQFAAQFMLLMLIFSALIGRFEIQQTSMEPNFHEGQRVMVSQFGSALSLPPGRTAYAATGSNHTTSVLRRSDVIVFYELPRDQDSIPLIKRLIGLPGETIEIRDGAVFINDIRLNEPYLDGVYTSCSQACGPLTLGPEEYYFLGDNRSVSRDSRVFGPIQAEQIVGRVILRYWPLDQFALDL